MDPRLPDTTPLTIPELQDMLLRHQDNAPVKSVIEQALSRRLREKMEAV
jgi:hypothetical protein